MVTRTEVEDILFLEADLLDSWQLNEWLSLYTEDAVYEVPSADLEKDADPTTSLFYIADDRFRLAERVVRLNKKTMWSEYPRSKTRHLVTNVRVLNQDSNEINVRAAFAVYRTKWGNTDVYIGSYEYVLKKTEKGLKIYKKRCVLELDSLRPQGRVSILL
jgi:p-cumate 2,3-dioxygenase beta subunit